MFTFATDFKVATPALPFVFVFDAVVVVVVVVFVGFWLFYVILDKSLTFPREKSNCDFVITRIVCC